MNLRLLSLLSLIALVGCQTSVPTVDSTTVVSSDPARSREIARVAEYWSDQFPKCRYIDEGAGRPAEFPGWSGYPLRWHRYTTKDGRSAEAITLEPSADQLARWVVDAVVEVKGWPDPEAIDALNAQILDASGAQFVVAGLALETNGDKHKTSAIYPFRDGVTVAIPGVRFDVEAQPTATEIARAIDPTITPTFAYRYARLQSTSRDDYRAAGGDAPVGKNGDLRWLDVVRRTYQAAWGNDRNELMVAWVRANL